MSHIEQDTSRYHGIVRGKIKQNLRRYMTDGQLIGRQGKDLVRIPLPQVDLPHFTFGKAGSGGVGQGPGQPGDVLAPGEPGDGEGGAGEGPGQHILEAEISIDELVQMLAEELELPRIEPKGKKNIKTDVTRYTDIRKVGPESLRHFKRTYREALKRQIMSGDYDPGRPNIVPVREDRRYRSYETKPLPESNAVIIYMMDVSGSMGEREKRLVRMTAFWIDAWLKSNYRNVHRRYIVHDAAAAEVDEETFYHLHQSGGTKISSALHVCEQLIQTQYSPNDWNIYLFQFSYGDNFASDNERSLEIIQHGLLPAANLYCYGQVDQRHYSDSFLEVLSELDEVENVVMTRIPSDEAIYDAIKLFLGKGK
ncbi:MAG TPA: DUF444 family protein [Caldilineaceae bacterium]|nr:DUF444 family protein [Caldilineaceae bacterium]